MVIIAVIFQREKDFTTAGTYDSSVLKTAAHFFVFLLQEHFHAGGKAGNDSEVGIVFPGSTVGNRHSVIGVSGAIGRAEHINQRIGCQPLRVADLLRMTGRAPDIAVFQCTERQPWFLLRINPGVKEAVTAGIPGKSVTRDRLTETTAVNISHRFDIMTCTIFQIEKTEQLSVGKG